MPRAKKKKQYTEIKNRTIYMLKNPLTNEFYVGHTLSHNMRSTYKDHYIGTKYKTEKMINNLKEAGLKPCSFALETMDSTAVEAYNHVIVWTKIMLDNGYSNLDKGAVVTYANDLLPKNIPLYQKLKDTHIEELTTCAHCLFPDYGRENCPLF